MHNDISQANFTTKPRFEDANCKFNRAQISKAAKMEKKHTWKQHESARV